MQKGHKRNNKGIAVVRFFCGLIFVAIIVFAVYCLLDKFDWSDSIKDPSITIRPYVEVTAAPNQTEAPEISATDTPEPIDAVDISTTEPTEAPTPTPEPTPIATATPTPEPTPIATATPEPTSIPAEAMSEYMTSGFTVPAAANDAERAITKLYISSANGNKAIQIDGYAFINEDTYDAKDTSTFLIVTHKASGKQVVYKTMQRDGISGDEHMNALCQNPSMSDFECFLDTSWYGNGEFGLGVVLCYMDGYGNAVYSYQEFEDCFTVTDGAAVLGSMTPAEEAAPEAEGEIEGEDGDAEGIEDSVEEMTEDEVFAEEENSIG